MPFLSAADTAKLIRQVSLMLETSNLEQAMNIARQALDAGACHPVLFNLRAFWLESQGRLSDAISDLENARTLAPDDAPVLNALGLAYARSGRLEDAVKCFNEATDHAPNFAHAYFNKGWASEKLGDLDIARLNYKHAIELDPRAGEPLAKLAALAARIGDWSDAETYAMRALAVMPEQPVALTALANVERARGELGSAEARLRTLLSRADLPPFDHAFAQGVLADVLAASKRHSEAFLAYTAQNDEFRRIYAPLFSNPKIQSIHEYLHWLIELFQTFESASWRAPAVTGAISGGARQHVFILGFPRSGTTLLEQTLGCHPEVVTTNEKNALTGIVREFMSTPRDIGRLARLTDTDLGRYRQGYWERISAYGFECRGSVVIDKLPHNSINLPLIYKLFPEAKILFAVRDPRDVVLSCFRQHFEMSPLNFEFLSLNGTAQVYDAIMRLVALYRTKLSLDLYQTRHEDIVENFDPAVQAICNFLGLSWTDTMRDFAGHRKIRVIASSSAAQIAQGLNREGIGQWRNYRAELAPILPIVRPWVEHFGYEAG